MGGFVIQQRLPGAFSSLTRETVFHLESGPGGGILLIGDYLPFTGDLEKSYRRVFQFCNFFWRIPNKLQVEDPQHRRRGKGSQQRKLADSTRKVPPLD
jgi:hypothetical protein